MYITLKIQMKPTELNVQELIQYSKYFKQEIFKVCAVFKRQKSVFEYRFKNISNNISWDSKGIVLSKAKEMYKANINGKIINLSFSSIWSIKSFYINSGNQTINLKLGLNQFQRELKIPLYWSKHLENRLSRSDPIVLKICQREKQWIAYVSVKIVETYNSNLNVMGIDIGIKVPAVTYTSDGKINFFGNGRELRYYQRYYRSKYQALQYQKNHKKMKQMNHKLHHKLNDVDHKIAKAIINYAITKNIGIIKMEQLKYINTTFDIKVTSNIYLWSYRRLQDMIEYKAKLNGIKVKYINPKNTSRICPKCGSLNSPVDRLYFCKACEYENHRDIVGAMNILRAL